MRHFTQGRIQRQVSFLRQQFLQDGNLPFTDVLSAEVISQGLAAIGACWNDRIFTPLVTLWVFLGQVLSADPSCRAAVARLIAHRVSQGLRPCSSETGAYCQARKRLPELFFSIVAFLVGRKLDASVDSQWLWKGRRVYLFDGSTVSMPDTAENRKEYPLTYNQKPGTGFPVARIGAIISLACGAIVNLGICRYAGKGQSELGMLRKLWGVFRRGDVLVADRLMCAWTEMVMLQQRGVDCVVRLTSHRTADFRRGMRLGKDDHIVKWINGQPARNRPAIHQFQGDASSAGGLSAGNQPASALWKRAPEIAVSTNVAGHRPAPRRRSPRPLRATHDETTAEKLQPPEKAAKGDQTRYDQVICENLRAIRVSNRSAHRIARFVGQDKDPDREGILFTGLVVQFLP
jgi:hypothetical protein